MELIYLSRANVESLNVSMREILDAVDEGFRLRGLGLTEMPPKVGIHPAGDAFIHAMPAYMRQMEVAGLKWVSGFPSNLERKLPYISGLLILNDPETGIPIAIMDCAWITAMRTGASVGISAKYLGNPLSRVAGLLGCGVQARTSLMAIVETLPQLVEVRCHDLYPAATERFITDMSGLFPQLRFTVSQTPQDVTRNADIVVTAIPIVKHPQPPLAHDLLRPGGLAVSLDYDSAWTTAAMRQCRFYCDDIDQLLYTRGLGDYFSGIPETIEADLGQLAAGKVQGRQSTTERIFSMNMGIAVDDMVTAQLLMSRARAINIGTRLSL